MKRSAISFFSLDENFRSKKIIKANSGIEDNRNYLVDINKDNEWMQEYYIIYKSYVLDDIKNEDPFIEDSPTV
jgi:hypothetical protein